jgi:large subunit ribosomal protein L5
MADDKKAEKAKGEGEAKPRAEKSGGADKGGGGKGAKGGGKGRGKGEAAPREQAVVTSSAEVVPARFLEVYKKTAIPALTKQFNYKNPMQVPRLQKIVVNMGLGAAVANPKIIDTAVEDMRAITGQKPVVTRAKKAIANFKLREGIPIGAMVTLRSDRMWEFLDRLISVALPRTRDFKGVSRKAFDGKGNYTLGLKEQIIFPEVDYDKIDAIKGLNISFVTTAKTDEEGRALLQQLGMPFRAA